MHRRISARTALTSIALGAIVIATNGLGSHVDAGQWQSALAPFLRASRTVPRTAEGRVAVRLQQRLQNHLQLSFATPQLEKALTHRRALLRRSITVTYEGDDGRVFPSSTINLSATAHLVMPTFTFSSIDYRVDPDQVQRWLAENPPVGMIPSFHAHLTSVEEKDGVMRATTDGPARAGYDVDERADAPAVAAALENNQPTVAVPVHLLAAHIFNDTGKDLGKLDILATGYSNFKGSGDGRKANVRKGISERLHNVVIAPGALFSFNSTLDKVTLYNGWQLAYAIFDGGKLVPVPGGGLCQVATTVYRAAINAGLPVVARANHSLFVSYYEAGGVGMDATIFPGSQDLVFRNDTGNYILIQAYTDGDDATVNLFGTRDGRSVALEGPFFTPTVLPELGRPVKKNEITWVRTVTDAAGKALVDVIKSQYKSVPASIIKKYAPVTVADAR